MFRVTVKRNGMTETTRRFSTWLEADMYRVRLERDDFELSVHIDVIC